MGLQHHVPAKRLTKDYFRRWWYWKGVSKARLERRHPITELGIDLREARTVAGVPRFMVGSALRDAVAWVGTWLPSDARERMRCEARLCYFAGYWTGARAPEVENPGRRAPNSGKSVPRKAATWFLHL
jgi:hypothetical protein